MAGVTAIQGVDDTLKQLATDAVAPLTPRPRISVGPPDVDATDLRLNWFLYRIAPNVAYRNMEPPQTATRTARGIPPLALELHYLLTAFPADAAGGAGGGDQEQFAHTGLVAVMQTLHANAIVPAADPAVPATAKPMVEPLRISMESLDLDAISKLWTSVSEPLRLSVGYLVSLVMVDSPERHVPGPPVRERRIAVAASMGPRLVTVTPARGSAATTFTVGVEGLTAAAEFTLAPEEGDPAGGDDGWAPTASKPAGTSKVELRFARPALRPGPRRLDVVATENGLRTGGDSIAVILAPTISGPTGAAARGSTLQLDTAHAAPGVEVFLRGVPLPAGSVTFQSGTRVDITIPADAETGPAELALRANRTAGPVFGGLTIT
jgi:hypothetical protein